MHRWSILIVTIAGLFAVAAQAAQPKITKAVRGLLLAVDTAQMDVYLGLSGGDIDQLAKGREEGLAGLRSAIKPALAAARSQTLRDAIKAYYTAADAYFEGAAPGGLAEKMNTDRLKSDLDAKGAALQLELDQAQ